MKSWKNWLIGSGFVFMGLGAGAFSMKLADMNHEHKEKVKQHLTAKVHINAQATSQMLHRYPAYVLSVYDGDTFTGYVRVWPDQYVEAKIRILDVDTPELRGDEKEQGEKSRAYVRSLIEGKMVTIRTLKRDSFGRYLADVWLTEEGKWIDVAEDIIKKGHGKRYEER